MNASPAPVGIDIPSGAGRDELGEVVRIDDAAPGAERDDDLRYAEGSQGALVEVEAERVELGVGEVEHVYGSSAAGSSSESCCTGPSSPGRTSPWPSNESRRPRASSRRRVGREVAPPERPGMDPAGVGDRSPEPGLHVVQGPGRPERLDPDLAAIAVVRQVEDGSCRLRPPDDREPDGVERPSRARSSSAQRVTTRPGSPSARSARAAKSGHSAWPRRPSVDEVARGVADDGDEAHARRAYSDRDRLSTRR